MLKKDLTIDVIRQYAIAATNRSYYRYAVDVILIEIAQIISRSFST